MHLHGGCLGGLLFFVFEEIEEREMCLPMLLIIPRFYAAFRSSSFCRLSRTNSKAPCRLDSTGYHRWMECNRLRRSFDLSNVVVRRPFLKNNDTH